MSSVRSVFAVGLIVGVAAEAFAHHSIAPFDQERFEEIEGVVTRLGWRNPHLTADIQVAAPDGSSEIWQIEGDAINALMRRGLSRIAWSEMPKVERAR